MQAGIGARTVASEQDAMAPNDYPVDMRIGYADSSSRGWAGLTITMIRFLAPLPHAVVLLFMGIAQVFVFLVAQ